MSGWADRLINRCTDDKWTDRKLDKRKEEHTNWRADWQKDKRTEGQITSKQINTQTDRPRNLTEWGTVQLTSLHLVV